MEKMTESLKDWLLWMYVVTVVAVAIHAACIGQETKTPGEIIYEKTHTR